MKKIINIFLVFTLSFIVFPLYAQSDVMHVSISDSEIWVWESFIIEASVRSDSLLWNHSQLQVEGIENFQEFSKNKAVKYDEINGNAVALTVFQMHFFAPIEWKYTIWPVKIITQDEVFENDTTFLLTVGVNNVLQKGPSEDIEENNTEERGTIKDIREISFPLVWKISFVALFFLVFYVLLSIVFSRDTKQQVTEENKILEVDENEIMRKTVKHLKKVISEINSEDFFRKYNILLREILERRGFAGAKNATLKELKKVKMLEGNPYFLLLKKSYKHEFSGKEVSLETRKKYIEKLLELLK